MSLGESYEAFIERMAGACPPPGSALPEPDEVPWTHRRPGEHPRAHLDRLYRADPHVDDDDGWPQPRSAPTTPPDDEALEVPDAT